MPWLLLLLFGALMLASNKVWGYNRGTPVEIELASIGNGFSMRADAAAAFLRMYSAAKASGIALVVESAFRSMEKQKELYARWLAGTGNLAGEPGFSNHQSGAAVDIRTGGTSTATYAWLSQNAPSYGFVRTVSSEPWHWEYKGAA